MTGERSRRPLVFGVDAVCPRCKGRRTDPRDLRSWQHAPDRAERLEPTPELLILAAALTAVLAVAGAIALLTWFGQLVDAWRSL